MDKKTRSYVMSCIKSESSIENIPKYLKGKYLRRHPKGVYGKPDFGNKSRKIALFIDGCFWHGCKEHFKMPKTNEKFWRDKIENNRLRDKKVSKVLKNDGWEVIRIWEHSMK